MILKKFTDQKQRTKLSKEDTIKYELYGSKVRSSMMASAGFKMVDFEQHKHQTVKFGIQVDKISNPQKKKAYDVKIGNDLFWNMGINIIFKEEQIQWNNDKIPLKTIGGTIKDQDFVKMFYTMHTSSPILQEVEDYQNKMLDYDYSKVDIDVKQLLKIYGDKASSIPTINIFMVKKHKENTLFQAKYRIVVLGNHNKRILTSENKCVSTLLTT